VAYLNFRGLSEADLSFFLRGGPDRGPVEKMERRRSWLTEMEAAGDWS
jgi:hypothetical protein